MAAITRWVKYDVSAAGDADTGGGTNYGRGTRGSSLAEADVDDSFQIGTNNNRLYLKADGYPVTEYGITLASGTDLDPRFVAKDIAEKMHNAGQGGGWTHAQCVWDDNQLQLYSGTLGSSSSITVFSGTNSAHLELGWGVPPGGGGGSAPNNGDNDNYITVSGSYNGFLDEIYRVVINSEVSIGTPSKDGSNEYTGTITTGGVYNFGTDITYTLIISDANGTTMGAGTGNVPILSWSSTSNLDDDLVGQELLYANYWYKVGTKGLMVKFTDAVFNSCNPAWLITCNAVEYAQGANADMPVGTAEFVWGSNRGDDADDSTVTTASGTWTELGSRGLYITFNAVSNLQAGDEWYVICKAPQPSSYDITNLNYGNVTVSTESPLRTVMFEIKEGAVEIDTVKFGLQSHGNFEHHGEGNNDTYFRYGNVGPGNNAGNSPTDGYEWWTNVTAADISSDTNPSYLYSTRENLSVVADADSSEEIGTSTYNGMVADPVWLNIKLGTSEVGANSTINYRIYFDYS